MGRTENKTEGDDQRYASSHFPHSTESLRLSSPEPAGEPVAFRRIGDLHSVDGRLFADKVLVVCELAESNECRCLDIPWSHRSVSLDHDHAVGSGILYRHRSPGEDRKLLGAQRVRFIAVLILALYPD